jgi:hypothetical protein
MTSHAAATSALTDTDASASCPPMREMSELGELAQKLHKHFKDAEERPNMPRRGKYRAPEFSLCVVFAFELIGIKDRQQPADLDCMRARKYGLLFLESLKPIRQLWGDGGDRWIDHIEQHVSSLLSWLDTRPLDPLSRERNDIVRIIGEFAQLAWATANDGKYPSTKEDSPLCGFIRAVLRDLGQSSISRETISQILEGKRRK